MFAAGRGIRGISNITGVKQKRFNKIPKPKSNLTFKEKLYVPCQWSPCLGCWAGMVLMAGGLVLSFLAYHAEYFSTSLVTTTKENDTDATHKTSVFVDPSLQYQIRNFMYIGPLVMGLGTLLAIIACVMICETRDKVLDMMEMKVWKNYTGKATFYELIVVGLKKKHNCENSGKDSYHFDTDGSLNNERGRLYPC